MMKPMIRIAVALTLFLGMAAPVQAAECADVRLPDGAKVAGSMLRLNGMGIREATIFNVDVYVAGLYLEKRAKAPRQVIGSNQKKRLVLRFVRDVDRDDIVEAFEDGFKDNAPGAYKKIRSKVAKLNGWMADVKDGQTLTFTYVPDRGLEVNVNGARKGVIEGKTFADAFFSIWFGAKPPNKGLKRGLLGGRCG